VWIEKCDGDGFAMQRADGTSAGSYSVVLKGGQK
jgi:hypothetical protein